MSKFPTAVNLHKTSNTLGLTYGPDEVYQLPAEFLRVHSPSAEVQGHGKPILQFGKLNVALEQDRTGRPVRTEIDLRRRT